MRKADTPLDGDAKKAVAYAAKEADHDRQYWIDSDHLLRALLRFPNDAANALLIPVCSFRRYVLHRPCIGKSFLFHQFRKGPG